MASDESESKSAKSTADGGGADDAGGRAGTDDVCGAARAAADVDDDDLAGGAGAEASDGGALEGPFDPNRNRTTGTDDALDPTDPVEAPPERVADLASACVRFVATRYGATLDFSPDTLSFVDQWVRDARAELGRRPELGDVVQAAAGAYLGEVIRRAFGGAWVTSEDMPSWRLMLSRVYCAFNPVGMVREALLLDRAEGWQAHFELDPGEREAVEQRLDALPPVGDDEFFAPSTRFDVISIVVDALRTAMDAQGLGDVRFSPEDY